jgi:hypothetical protein
MAPASKLYHPRPIKGKTPLVLVRGGEGFVSEEGGEGWHKVRFFALFEEALDGVRFGDNER